MIMVFSGTKITISADEKKKTRLHFSIVKTLIMRIL